MAIEGPEAIDDASARGPQRSGGRRPGGFLASRGMRVRAQGKKVDRPSLRQGGRGVSRPSARSGHQEARGSRPGPSARETRPRRTVSSMSGPTLTDDQPRPTGKPAITKTAASATPVSPPPHGRDNGPAPTCARRVLIFRVERATPASFPNSTLFGVRRHMHRLVRWSRPKASSCPRVALCPERGEGGEATMANRGDGHGAREREGLPPPL